MSFSFCASQLKALAKTSLPFLSSNPVVLPEPWIIFLIIAQYLVLSAINSAINSIILATSEDDSFSSLVFALAFTVLPTKTHNGFSKLNLVI